LMESKARNAALLAYSQVASASWSLLRLDVACKAARRYAKQDERRGSRYNP